MRPLVHHILICNWLLKATLVFFAFLFLQPLIGLKKSILPPSQSMWLIWFWFIQHLIQKLFTIEYDLGQPRLGSCDCTCEKCHMHRRSLFAYVQQIFWFLLGGSTSDKIFHKYFSQEKSTSVQPCTVTRFQVEKMAIFSTLIYFFCNIIFQVKGFYSSSRPYDKNSQECGWLLHKDF